MTPPLDLDAIEARAKAIVPWSSAVALLPLRGDALALVAEVRRLRFEKDVLIDAHTELEMKLCAAYAESCSTTARSWTGRECAEAHNCAANTTHRSADGTRWRGNADVMPAEGPLPANLRIGFLAMVECYAKGNDEARKEGDCWRQYVLDTLANACGVAWVEDEELGYWVGPWPTNYAEWYLKDPRTADEICRFRMWHPSAWGCAL